MFLIVAGRYISQCAIEELNQLDVCKERVLL